MRPDSCRHGRDSPLARRQGMFRRRDSGVLRHVAGVGDEEAVPGRGRELLDHTDVVEGDRAECWSGCLEPQVHQIPGVSWKSLTVSAQTRMASGWPLITAITQPGGPALRNRRPEVTWLCLMVAPARTPKRS